MKFLKITLASILALLIIAFVTGYILYLKNNTEVLTLDDDARKNVSGSFVQLTDGITHYELAGPDTGKVVVLVHGFSVPYYIWDSTFVKLVNEGYRVLRYDEYGRGFSDRPEKAYEAAFLRKQLEELLTKLNLSSVHAIAGLSFGGPVVTDFVVHHPTQVDKIILVDPVYPVETGGASGTQYPEGFMNFMMAISPEDMVAGQLTDLKYPERFPQWGDQYKVQMQYKGLRQALISTRLHYGTPEQIRDSYEKLDLLGKPVLLIWGKEDNTTPFSNSDELRKVLHTDFVPIEDAMHLPHMEKASEVNPTILGFLNATPQL
jgi:pimeloyl-ACP methyl ester carboxylesterase